MKRTSMAAADNANPLDPNPALRAELLAALVLIDPQIRGLYDLSHIPPSTDLGAIIAAELENMTRRRDLIVAVLGTLAAGIDARESLAADGYPAVKEVQVPEGLFLELKSEVADVEAAAALFEAMASTMTIEFGDPVDK
jgi:hypothetical protein